MFKTKLILFSLLFLLGCGAESGTPEAIFGKWQGVSWTVEGSGENRNAAAVYFQFQDANQYQAEFGDQQESGSFKVEGDKLYTTAEGQMQKMVRIVKLTADTLEMEMNRGGVKENLVLKKAE